MQESSFFDESDHYRPEHSGPAPHAWEAGPAAAAPEAAVEHGHDDSPPLFHVRLALEGTHVDVLAAVCEGGLAIEDLRAEPPLPLADLVALAGRIERPLADVCRGVVQQYDAPCRSGYADDAGMAFGARPSGRQVAAEAYREAREEGRDPVLAVMGATGHSRRKALRLIAGARDDGYLAPRHRRR
ncbi:DUF6214 family protein [Streptomyces sp. NPDC059063]|uniref:DUF6214 family protein n=1 Tax=unclassified Streptomyces TaxID=2593676 RepID=UPI0036A2571C